MAEVPEIAVGEPMPCAEEVGTLEPVLGEVSLPLAADEEEDIGGKSGETPGQLEFVGEVVGETDEPVFQRGSPLVKRECDDRGDKP